MVDFLVCSNRSASVSERMAYVAGSASCAFGRTVGGLVVTVWSCHHHRSLTVDDQMITIHGCATLATLSVSLSPCTLSCTSASFQYACGIKAASTTLRFSASSLLLQCERNKCQHMCCANDDVGVRERCNMELLLHTSTLTEACRHQRPSHIVRWGAHSFISSRRTCNGLRSGCQQPVAAQHQALALSLRLWRRPHETRKRQEVHKVGMLVSPDNEEGHPAGRRRSLLFVQLDSLATVDTVFSRPCVMTVLLHMTAKRCLDLRCVNVLEADLEQWRCMACRGVKKARGHLH